MQKRILLLAPFFRGDSRWLDDFCVRPDLHFTKAPFTAELSSWHERGGTTPAREWLLYDRYAAAAMRSPYDGIVTCFPQLALVAAARLRLQRRPTRLIAWNFNLGSVASPWKGRLAGRILSRVDRFVVHASGEIGPYADWLALAREKFRFAPLQCARAAPRASPIARPYVVSMGSAHRDYASLAAAVRGSGIRTVIIAGGPLLAEIPEDPDLIKLHGLSRSECDDILAGAEISVVPIADRGTAAGQVTFTKSMRAGVATIATRCVGTVDYLRNGETGLLVPGGDVAALRQAILSLWNQPELRKRIADAGSRYAERELSDEAAGANLGRLLDEVLSA